ncbi:MAG: AarF/UbiB family protein [Candidatus Caenarcaniphilales bacterium]|nr:AarF/UbiB family protein [Candidatus Caenarcaniphilales bacterium]
MNYYPNDAKKLFPLLEDPVFPKWLDFLNFLIDLFLIASHSFRNRRFYQGAKLALILWLSIKQEVDAENKGLKEKKLKSVRSKHAKWLFNQLNTLGAAFIKVGQFIATREDIVPKEYVSELQSLQDAALPMPIEEVKEIIEKNLNGKISDFFDQLDEKAIASASIAQVHRATLKNKEEVVIKVQRPGLKEKFLNDVGITRAFSVFFERYSSWGKHRYWPEICDQFGKVLFEEIDFKQELLNIERMRINLENEHPEIIIPKVHKNLSTTEILVMDYCPGDRITDLDVIRNSPHSTTWISDKLIKLFFDQFFIHGFFHADPHPGNLGLNKQGKIVLYDYGMTYKIDEKIRDNFKALILAVVAQDTDKLVQSLKMMDLIRPNADLELLKKLIREVTYKYYSGSSFSELNLQNIKNDINKIIANSPMRMPPSLAYVFRTLGILEGLCRTLNPKFDFIATLKPFTKEWFLESKDVTFIEKLISKVSDQLNFSYSDEVVEIAKLPLKANSLMKKVENGELKVPINLELLENRINRIETVTLGIAYLFLGIIVSIGGIMIDNFLKLKIAFFSNFVFYLFLGLGATLISLGTLKILSLNLRNKD